MVTARAILGSSLFAAGAIAAALQGYSHARSLGENPDYIALAAKLTMALLLLIYVNLCVRSFIQARRSRQV